MTPPPVGELIARRYELRGAPRQFPGYTGYRAFDREVEVEVALWWIRPELYPSAADRAAFVRAAGVARAMRNHNARRVFDAGEANGGLFATVQLASHQPRIGAPSDAELLERAVALCSALSRAHEDGFVHGRLVPDDVVYVNGLLKIGGIGLWGESSEAARTVWGEASRYIAPEAWLAEAVTPRADVFSAAVILAELACGGGSAWHRSGAVGDLVGELSRARPDVAAELASALALDPAARTPSMPALLEAMRRALLDDSMPTTQLAPLEAGEVSQRAAPGAVGAARRSPTSEVEAIDVATTPSDETRKYVRPAEPEHAPLAAPPPPPPPPVRAVAPPAPPPVATSDAMPGDAPEDATVPFARGPDEPLQLPLAAGPQSARMAAVSLSLPAAPRERGLLPYVLAGLVAAIGVGLIVWVALASYFGRDDASDVALLSEESTPADAAPSAQPTPPAVDPVLVAPAPRGGPCPSGMAQVERFCIDTHESPGEGRLPETGLALADAAGACAARGARLCSADEWERACRGPRHSSFPYGEAYRRGKCNADQGGRGAAAAGGSHPDCRSEEGIFDLSGNVAEWVADGRARGGSAQDGTDGRCSRRRRAKQDRGYSDVGFRCCADSR